jgi:hypothetical protein
MDRFAIFVDAGYLFAAGTEAVIGRPAFRRQITVRSYTDMISSIRDQAAAIAGNLPILRTYWYDGMPGCGQSSEHSAISKIPGVKVRFGGMNNVGKQKGVDSFLVADMVDLAQKRAIADAVLVSGDADLCMAVQMAQSYGVRVHVLAIGDPEKNVSQALIVEADSVSAIGSDWIMSHFMIESPETRTASEQETVGTDFDEDAIPIIEQAVAAISAEEIEQIMLHLELHNQIPSRYDRPLIAKASSGMNGRQFNTNEKRRIRELFVGLVREASLYEAGSSFGMDEPAEMANSNAW